jgi:hypothetical protein
MILISRLNCELEAYFCLFLKQNSGTGINFDCFKAKFLNWYRIYFD